MDFPSHSLAIAGVIIGLALWYYNRRTSGKSKGKLPPEPAGALPIIGHLHLLQPKNLIFRTFGAMADQVGPVFMIRLGMHRAVVVSDHEAAQQCFTTNDKAFATRPISASGKHLNYNFAALAMTPYGPYWREIRKLAIVEILCTRRLRDLLPVQVSELEAGIRDLYSLGSVNDWINPQKVAICKWFDHLLFNVSLRMIAGKRYISNVVDGSEEAGSAIEKIRKIVVLSGEFVASDAYPFLERLDIQGHLSSMKLAAMELDKILDGWVQEHRGRPNNGKDFIDVMLTKLEDDSFYGHSRETVIKATSLTMILAGTETTSITLVWLFSSLLNNKDLIRHAQEELDSKVGKDRWVEQSDIQNLTYLQAIVKETLRLYPAVPILVPHEAIEDCKIGAYDIPKGTRLLFNSWKLHRDPSVWSNPEEFRPERFLTTHEKLDVFGQHFEFLPFGSGRRSCPGLNLALQVVHLTAARLLQGFDMTTPADAPVDMREGVGATMPKLVPLEVMVTPRLRPELYSSAA